MLTSVVTSRQHPRRTPPCSGSFFSTCKPFRITSLTLPHILSSVESHPYKKDPGGHPHRCPECCSLLRSLCHETSSSATTLQIAPLFSTTSRMLLPQPFPFHAFALLPGGWHPPQQKHSRNDLNPQTRGSLSGCRMARHSWEGRHAFMQN